MNKTVQYLKMEIKALKKRETGNTVDGKSRKRKIKRIKTINGT